MTKGQTAMERPIYPGKVWQHADRPEELGWSSELLAEARTYSEQIGSAAVMIVDGGVVVDAWGDITRNYYAHSMRKSLLNALYGIYVQEGKIDMTKTLEELGIDDHTPLTETEKQATVADLLKARSGVYIPAIGESPLMKATRPARGDHAPGTYWYYNNWDFNALGTIFDQQTGETSIFHAFKVCIADPIGMQDFRIEDLHYTYDPRFAHPYYGFLISARDLARYGLLYARGGRWGDEQIISASWAAESTSPHSDAGAFGGYGYMWWIAVDGRHLPNVNLAEGSFSAQGGPGQYLLVIPAHDIVIVHLVDSFDSAKEVPIGQFGHLIQMILQASGKDLSTKTPYVDDRIGLDEAELPRFAGQYEGQTLPLSAQVELHDGGLLVIVGDVGRFDLAPITSTRYQIENWRGAEVEFSIGENRIETMTVTLCDSRTLEFKPTGESGGS
jgi:CubicO group peptidase (beta-lactamase class C family)